MGKVSKEQAGKNREAVVQATSRLLRVKGVNGVGVRELMAAVGLTQGAFTKQFASKEALVGEACTLIFESAERALVASTQDRAPGHSRRLAEAYFNARPADFTCPMATLAIDAARLPEDSAMRQTFARGVERLADVMAGDPPSSERLVLLAAMVGAYALMGADGNSAFSRKMEAAVVAYADSLD